jgi:RHS repeat-associated protein
VAVRVLAHQRAAAAGVKGVLFTVASSSAGGGPARVGVSYAGFAQAYGGNYGQSLRLAELPACALTTPAAPGCRRETPLASLNDTAADTVSAAVALPAAPAVSPASSGAAVAQPPAAPPVVLAAVPASYDGGGPAGTYSATSLRPSGTWTAGGSSGSFTYSYPISVPPAVSDLVPAVSLDYDSGSVDGQTASTQAQSSWAGDGWSTPASFIEQTFTPCQDDPEGTASPAATADECYDGPVLTLSVNGTSTPLVCPLSSFSYTTTSTCTPSDDDGAVVTHVVDSGNGSGTQFTDYWTVTERDGTTYYFGLNELPGWAAGDATTNSVAWMPVFSAHPGDPCYSAAGFAASVCDMAYRWNLDYVTDVHGNAMAYYYDQALNAYAEDGNTASAATYVRDTYLDHIDYGFTTGSAYTAAAPDEVEFTTGDRCFTGTCDPLSAATAANWLDVPYYDYCAAGSACQVTGPTFWSTVRLASIYTRQWNGTAYVQADSWALAEHFPATGDGTSPALWLDSITRTGDDTTAGGPAVTLPAVSFTGTDMPNRLNPGDYPALDRYRIADITTETGAVITVAYEQTSPCNPASPPDPAANTSSCFPVYWQEFPDSGQPDWFIKYAVSQVTETDPTGGSPGLFTSYQYAGPAWHYDDNEVVQPQYRTWGQWRGYGDVKTFTGTGSDTQTEAETTYYQGMSDDNDSTPVTLTDSQGGQHDDTDQLAGQVLESTDYNFAGGPVLDSQIYSYWVSAPAASRTRTGLPALTANFTGLVEEWTRTAITDTGATTWRDTETDTSYDATPADADFGLPLFVYDHGDLSQPAQQICTSYAYAPANTAENLVGLVAETQVDAAGCGGSGPGGASAPGSGEVNALTAPAAGAQVVSDTRTFYDDPSLAQTWPQPASPAWPQAVPATGDVSVVQQASADAGGTLTYQTTSAAVYDSYGRPVAAYDGNGNQTTTSYVTAGGVTTGETVTNALGQATTTILDPLRGLPVKITDPNGVFTTLYYDGLGRVIDVWEDSRPPVTSTGAANPANYVYGYNVSDTAPTVVTTEQLNAALGYVTSTTLYDALLRVRQTQVPNPNSTGILVSGNFYDSRGWLYETNSDYNDPSASPGGSIVPVPESDEADEQVTAFDGLGRPVLVTSYDDSQPVSYTATQYTGDTVTTAQTGPQLTDVLPGATSTVTDALGRTTQISQYTSPPAVTATVSGSTTTVSVTGGTTQATTYSYNGANQVTGISYAGQNWATSYNLLGQVTASTDPSAGTTTDAYDGAGNLTATTDADGKTISYTYDALNRETGEYDGPNSSSPPIATWTYDNSNDAVPGMTDPIGQLTTETSYDSAGNAYTLQQNGFNAFGESTGQTWTIPADQGALAGTYTLTSTYTPTTGQPYRTTYPASPGGGELPAETIGYGYTPGYDLPNTVNSTLAGYDVATSYNADFQVAQAEIGSSTSNAYITDSYDPHTGNLTDTQVANTAVSSTPYDNTSYTYDPAGNITSETDVQDPDPATSTGQAETQCYDYNSLDQLTQAWTATDNCAANPASNDGATVGDQIPGSAYWTAWTYTPLGEPSTQTSYSLTGGQNTVSSYTYGTSQPATLAALTDTGPAGTTTSTYGYDPAGNTTSRDLPSGDQALTWNDDGTLATDATPAGTVSYIYDADGNVLIQKDTATALTTLYIFGEQIVLNNTTGAITGTRFISLPGGAEVVRTGPGSDYTYQFANQQDTGVLTLNSAAQDPQWQQYTPYGAPRGTPPASWPDTNGFLNDPTDPTSGLTIIGARQYDPATGLFLSIDPLLEPASPLQLNGYSYAEDNPVTNSDPTGLFAPMLDGGGGGPCPSGQDGCVPGSGTQTSQGTGCDATCQQTIRPYPVGGPIDILAAALHPLLSLASMYLSGEEVEAGNYQAAVQPNIFSNLDSKLMAHADPNSDLYVGTNIALLFIPFAAEGDAARGVDLIADAAGATAPEDGTDLIDAATCGGMSFSVNTNVLLASGAAIPISKVKVGDRVLATNVKTGKTQAEPVAAVLVHHDTDLYDLTVRTAHGTSVIETTSSHLFWDPASRRWVEAVSLGLGEPLKTPSGTIAYADGGTTPASQDGWMWDLAVPSGGDHDFYIKAAETAVLAHNCPISGDDNNGGWSTSARMRAAGPGDEYGLPSEGKIRYVPPNDYNPVNPLPRGEQDGYLDRFGNEWIIGPSRTPGQPFEWDVQLSRTGQQQIGWLSRDGIHVNVSPLGEVTH